MVNQLTNRQQLLLPFYDRLTIIKVKGLSDAGLTNTWTAASTCSLIVFSSLDSFGSGGVETVENGILAAVSRTTKIHHQSTKFYAHKVVNNQTPQQNKHD